MEKQVIKAWNPISHFHFFKEDKLEDLNHKKIEPKAYDWKLDDIDVNLINGYYIADGREASQVLQTPFENFCIAKINDHYDLFQIGCLYRPIVVHFEDHLEIKDWFENQLSQAV